MIRTIIEDIPQDDQDCDLVDGCFNPGPCSWCVCLLFLLMSLFKGAELWQTVKNKDYNRHIMHANPALEIDKTKS